MRRSAAARPLFASHPGSLQQKRRRAAPMSIAGEPYASPPSASASSPPPVLSRERRYSSADLTASALPAVRARRASAPAPMIDAITPEKLRATLSFMQGVLAQAEQQEKDSPPITRARARTVAGGESTQAGSPLVVRWQGKQEVIQPIGGGVGVKAMSRQFDEIRARSLSSPQMLDPSKIPGAVGTRC